MSNGFIGFWLSLEERPLVIQWLEMSYIWNCICLREEIKKQILKGNCSTIQCKWHKVPTIAWFALESWNHRKCKFLYHIFQISRKYGSGLRSRNFVSDFFSDFECKSLSLDRDNNVDIVPMTTFNKVRTSLSYRHSLPCPSVANLHHLELMTRNRDLFDSSPYYSVNKELTGDITIMIKKFFIPDNTCLVWVLFCNVAQ